MGLYFTLFTGGICPGVHTILAVASPRTNIHASFGDFFVRQGQDTCLGVEWGVCMGIYCFFLLNGGVGPGARSILVIGAPWADFLATSWEFFFCWGQIECLGIEWDFFLGLGFFQGGGREFSGGIFPGFYLILAVASPETDIFAGDRACFVLWVQSESLSVEWRFCLCLVLGLVFCLFLTFDFI